MNKTNLQAWIHIIAAVVLLISFFLPWLNWDGSEVKGMSMANGDFFKISASRFDLENPFPQLSFIFYIFWLIPVLSAGIVVMVLMKKKTIPVSYITAAMSLGLVTVYLLFTRILVDLGVGSSVRGMLKPWIYLNSIAAISLIFSAYPVKHRAWQFALLILGPVIAFGSFKFGEKQVIGQTHKLTKDVKADYTLKAQALINEFLANDTAANRKYLNKMIEVNGSVTEANVMEDSTSVLKFADSTGSYAIFSFEKDQLDDVKNIKGGDPVSVKEFAAEAFLVKYWERPR